MYQKKKQCQKILNLILLFLLLVIDNTQTGKIQLHIFNTQTMQTMMAVLVRSSVYINRVYIRIAFTNKV